MSYTHPQAYELAARHGLAFSRSTWDPDRAIVWSGLLHGGDDHSEAEHIELLEVSIQTGAVQRFEPTEEDLAAGDYHLLNDLDEPGLAAKLRLLAAGDILGPVGHTGRGFENIDFRDRYDAKASLQQSSLADYTQPGISAVWLGLDGVKPQIMKSDAARLGLPVKGEVSGWMDYPLPEEAHTSCRMHLDRSQVKSLILHLQSWLVTGSLDPDTAMDLSPDTDGEEDENDG